MALDHLRPSQGLMASKDLVANQQAWPVAQYLFASLSNNKSLRPPESDESGILEWGGWGGNVRKGSKKKRNVAIFLFWEGWGGIEC